MLAIAASHDWNVIQLDVQTAFLQSEMKEEIYVKQPVRFEKLDQNGQPYVCKLKKSLYVLKQSPRNWHGTIQHELITERFKACMCDPCVYVKDDSSSKAFIVLYVDDLLVTGSSEVGTSKTNAFLMTEFAMDLGDVSLILGMQVSRGRLKGALDIIQGNYVKEILQTIRVCRQQIGKHTRHWKTPGPKTRNSAGRWQQAAIPRNFGKSHLFIDVHTLGHCLLHNAANSGDEQSEGRTYVGREEGTPIP